MKARILALGLLASTIVAAPAGAATLNFIATPDTAFAPAGTSGFSIVFDDSDHDNLLDAGEPVSFSGLTFDGVAFNTLIDIPFILGKTDSIVDTFWKFNSVSNGGLQVQYLDWDYTIAAAAAPLPAALPLFASGLAGFAGLLWRRRRPRRLVAR